MDPTIRQPQTQSEEQKGLAQRVSEKVQQTTEDVRSKSPGELMENARATTGEAIDSAKQKASEVTSAASEKATGAMTAAGDQMATLAQTVREKAPVEGKAGEIAANAADTLERSGRYLQEADPQMIRSDLERVIREHPIEAMLVGLGLGYLLARSMRR